MGKYRVKTKMKVDKKNIKEEQIDTKGVQVELTKSLSREIKITIITIFLVCIAALAGSYSIFTTVKKSEKYNTLTIGTLKVDFLQKTGNVINLNGAYPTSDDEGQDTEPYAFTLSNTGNLDAGYKIKIVNDEEMIAEDGCQDNLLEHSKIKVSINNGEPFLLSSKEGQEFMVEDGKIAPDNTKDYEFRIWITDTAGNEVLGRHYHGKIVIDSVNLSTDEQTN